MWHGDHEAAQAERYQLTIWPLHFSSKLIVFARLCVYADYSFTYNQNLYRTALSEWALMGLWEWEFMGYKNRNDD